MTSRTFFCTFVSGFLVALPIVRPNAFAAPDPFVLLDPPEAVFQGDQIAGIAAGVDFNSPPIYFLLVEDLTAPIAPLSGKPGIDVSHLSPRGSHGSGAYLYQGHNGSPGGSDAGAAWPNAPVIGVDFNPGILSSPWILTTGENAHGILAQSRGGNGGNGQDIFGYIGYAQGGNGGAGGRGVRVEVDSKGSIQTNGLGAAGILAESAGGNGGHGGNATSIGSKGGWGGIGASAGAVVVSSTGAITTAGTGADAIVAQSMGGAGGDGGRGYGLVSAGGGALGSGPGSLVHVENIGALIASGAEARGIFAQSVGGHNGTVAGASGLWAWGGSTQSAGDGGEVSIGNYGAINSRADSITALSIGGGGGRAKASSGAFTWGGTGSAGGHGGVVRVENYGALEVQQAEANGIIAQSAGGGGGAGSVSSGFVAFGGAGGAGGNGSDVSVENFGNITTNDRDSSAILAQCVGGGGGSAGGALSASAFFGFALGGTGGDGGYSSRVDVRSTTGALNTTGDRSHGILAESIGGGGGNGGFAVTLTGGWMGTVSVSAGGAGGGGGDGSTVNVDNASPITTHGSDAYGILAQSLGGGGGNGGFSISGAGTDGVGVSLAFGGAGGDGGVGKDVSVTSSGNINTSRDRSIGIFAQSIGGGGGNGGFSITGSGGGMGALSLGVGGIGGGGGVSDTVHVTNSGNITTGGAQAYGVFAQSIGGGGGNGGFNIAAAGGGTGAGALSVGGSGGGGGNSKSVTVNSSGSIGTSGDDAIGLFAQSVGGGGGNGGFSISGAGAGTGAGSITVGGSGGAAGNSDAVLVDSISAITTAGYKAHAILAQSIGGGGGNGGFSIGFSGAGTGAGTISVGGFGESGGDGKAVTLRSHGEISTAGKEAIGLFAQSLGGGGGNGGFSISGSGAGTGAGTFNLGGAGGGGGEGDTVFLESTNNITTLGIDAHGIFAQSLGGGGGNGGFSIAGSGAGTGAGTIAIGGFGDGGGSAKEVTVTSTGNITTSGTGAIGINAQSLGGGGGNGGFSISGTGAGTGSGTLNLGGSGAGGGVGGIVNVTAGSASVASSITTSGDDAYGILAQSVGGGGGKGGFSIAGSGAGTGSGTLGIGGSGGGGGAGEAVAVTSYSAINTSGIGAVGLMAQSVGGGGGIGGFSIAGSGAATGMASLGLGGSGGAGGTGASVTVAVHADGNISTHGLTSYGILAQSVGGGGGKGGFSFTGGVTTSGGGLNAAVGGSGGAGGNASFVNLTSAGVVTTTGGGAHGIIAQSVGGGGGTGGFSGSISASISNKPSVSLSIGGKGGVAGNGDNVTLNNIGSVATQGVAAYGIFAQSVGGGGGDGGGSFSAALGTQEGGWNGSLAIGGGGGAAGNGGALDVDNSGNITTAGSKSHGFVAQSVGGGGGTGGFSITGSASKGTGAHDIALSFGGAGGLGKNGGPVDVFNSGDIITQTTALVDIPENIPVAADPLDAFGNGASGILAQSIGGGGGAGGFSFAGSFAGFEAKNVSLAVGGQGGNGGSGAAVNVVNQGVLETRGANSPPILAQSIGGGGGSGGASIAVDFNLSHDQGVSTNDAISIGGAAGNGNTAGKVDVTSSNDVTSRGVSSPGILAQSIGGGGGVGGHSLSGTVGLETKDKAQSVDVAMSVGGAGGVGNDGGIVWVTNSGAIDTFKDDSSGIFAQSVGGGGGKGGSSRAAALDTNLTSFKSQFQNFQLSIKDYVKDLLSTWNVTVGGRGGLGSDGDEVKIINQSAINTRGDVSYGILAQSIGGGGGVGGGADTGLATAEWVQLILDVTPLTTAEDLQFNLGGSDGSSGAGGPVHVENSAAITTEGDGSSAIFAQSIGGGGGVATGDISIGIVGLDFGARAGASGNANVVTVEHGSVGHPYTLATSGDGANGILAQSIGGGGGVAGVVNRGIGSFGKNVAFAAEGGGGGTGNNVSITSVGSITTSGLGASGIVAQSIGGGGGLGGDGAVGFAGSVGGAGSAGIVTVTHSGNITTAGHYSHGIVAQSAGGTGSGGAVNVTLSGAVVAPGTNATGIVAQSRGDVSGANINVTLNAGASVHGGAVGVRMLDGVTNTLTNHGTMDAVSGNAIMAATGNDVVQNYGTIIGAVDLGAGTNAFHNYAGAIFAPGDVVNLGVGNALVNDGTVTPGNSALESQLTGNLVQSESGVLELEIGGLAPGSSDLLRITGDAALGGQLQLGLLDSFFPSAADIFTVMSASLGIRGAFTNVATGQRLTTIDGSGSFLVHYGTGSAFDPKTIILSAFAALSLPGDFNSDGAVDAADYVVWRAHPEIYEPADYGVWRANFGRTSERSTNVAARTYGGMDIAVPEPRTLVLLGAVGVLFLSRRPKRETFQLAAPRALIGSNSLRILLTLAAYRELAQDGSIAEVDDVSLQVS